MAASAAPLSVELPTSFVAQEHADAAQQHYDQGDFVQALKAFNRLLDLEPHQEAGTSGKVRTLQRLGRPRGALKACEAALNIRPDSSTLLALRSELWEELGEEEAQEVSAPIAPEKANEDQDTDCGNEDEELFADCESCTSEDEGLAPCPSSKTQARAEREARAMRTKSKLRAALSAEPPCWDSEASAPFRETRKAAFLEFYRDFYARTRSGSVDTSQYTKAEKSGLSIKGGHRHMPRPQHVELPAGHGDDVGTLTPAQLAEFAGEGCRILVSVHGDLFDVSDRPDKYGPDGPYSTMAGRDITWALWSGMDEDGELDKYFDLQRAATVEERDRRMQGLMSWWCFFEQEYGSPVGRLDVYDKEWELPAPPAVEDLCTIM